MYRESVDFVTALENKSERDSETKLCFGEMEFIISPMFASDIPLK